MRQARWIAAIVLNAAMVTAGAQSMDSGSVQHSQAEYSLLPEPASVVTQTGAFRLQAGMTVSLPASHSDRLQRATLRAMKRLEDRTGLPMARQVLLSHSGGLQVNVAGDGPPVQGIDDDESYKLTVTPGGIVITAATTTGALRGLETLLQLVQPQADGFVVPAVTVQDAPRFPWRGLMIDCGRHFEPLYVLKRNIDAMAAVKLNVFHWHLTEDQGFRIESKLYPKLTALGSDGLFYTQDDARALVQYARDRGIRVVPEFEMPGHSAAWLVAYPELASGTVPTGIRREFGVSDVAIDPTRPETYVFLEAFLREMTTIFPDQYLHIGGDETPAPDWKTNPRILAFMQAHHLKDNDALQAYFNQQVLAILTKLHRRMVGWDEILNPALPKDVVIQSWRGEASLAKGAQQGYQGVLSAPYYLDGMKPAGVMYLADPVPADTTLTPAEQKLILGGEVAMWAEQLDARTIDSRIWPRTAAIAERFWSAQNVRNVPDMYRRLEPVSLELESLGLRHLSQEDVGLRALARTQDIAALHTVAQAFEPVGFGERYEAQHTSQLTPLTGFVDAVRPDPVIRFALQQASAAILQDPTGASAEGLEGRRVWLQFFDATSAALPTAGQQVSVSPLLQPVKQRIDMLPQLIQIGREALQSLQTGTAMPQGWKQASLATFAEAKKPSAIVRYTFLQPLTDLVTATK